MSDLNIAAEISKKHTNTIIIKLDGFIDGNTTPNLEGIVNKIFKRNCFSIIFDLSNINYISSAGIGIFTAFNSEVKKHGGKIILSSLPESIFKVFKLLGVNILFQFTDSVEEAEENI